MPKASNFFAGLLTGAVCAFSISTYLFTFAAYSPPLAKIFFGLDFVYASGTPTITSISPSTVPAGGSDTTITIEGSGFSQESVVLYFPPTNLPASYTSFSLVLPMHATSSNRLTATIPTANLADIATAVGQYQIRVGNPGGGTSNSVPFTVIAPNPIPTITSISPASAIVGSNGFTLTVNGTNFIPQSVIKWNGTSLSTTYVTANQLTTSLSNIPNAGTYSVTVANPSPGGGDSNSITFTINNPQPTINALIATLPGLSPAGVLLGSGTTLTINGTGFVPTSSITLRKESLESVLNSSYVSSNRLTAVLTEVASTLFRSGPVAITVSNPEPGGGTSNSVTFTVVGTPTITSVYLPSGYQYPVSVPAGSPDVTITVNGTNFSSLQSSIPSTIYLFSPTAHSVATIYVSPTQLRATIPASYLTTSGNFNIMVFNDTLSSDFYPFNVIENNPVPVVTNISPISTVIGGSSFILTVNGSNFLSSSQVMWNGSPKTTTFVNPGQLRASILASDIVTSGLVYVTVFNPLPGGGYSNFAEFTRAEVIRPPLVP